MIDKSHPVPEKSSLMYLSHFLCFELPRPVISRVPPSVLTGGSIPQYRRILLIKKTKPLNVNSRPARSMIVNKLFGVMMSGLF